MWGVITGGVKAPRVCAPDSAKTLSIQTGLSFPFTQLTSSIEEPWRSLLRMGNLMRQLCYSLFLSFFSPIRVTSEVGWATPKEIEREKKKRQSQTPTPSSPFSSPLFLLPLPLLVSPILCEKLKASVVRAQSVEVAGY